VTSVAFALVDVFADEPLSGNPLAVVPDADQLSEHLMPRIAREFNQAETTFLLAPTAAGADHRLRSFTAAGVEVYGAGHNALGAWWWLAEDGRLDRSGVWHQQIGPAVLPVHVSAERVAMSQEPARYGATVEPGSLAAALGVDVATLGAAAGLPAAQVVDTGAAHLMVGLRDREAVEAVAPDTAALRALLLDADGEGCYLYALNPAEPDATAHARFFNPVAGIVEDPATGTAAGPLACLLHRHGLAGDRAVIAQGHHLGRPSRIEVTLDGDTPVVAGRAVVSATGTLRLP
jgi:trans-2,3-dihydro-3-hydroxyanthranilate isomerase